MPDEKIEAVEEDNQEFDAAFSEKAEKSANADPEDSGEVETDGAGENENDFNDAFVDAAGEPAAAEEEEEPEVNLSDELEKTKAEIERLKQSERSQRGRVSALTKKLVEQQAANVPPVEEQEITADADTTDNEADDWDEFQREFPEMAAIVDKRLSSVTKQVDSVASQVNRVSTTQDTLVQDKISTYKEGQLDSLREAHADVDDIKVSQEFAQWREKASEEIQTKIKSQESDDAVEVLNAFKKETGWTKTPPEPTGKSKVELITEKRAKNLQKSAGISSKKVGRSTRSDTESSDDFDSAFEDGAKKKEKQRARMYS